MIKYDKIKVNISYRNITHYRKLGYNPILKYELEINVFDLPSSSHVKVIAICSICNCEKSIIYCKYIDNKKRQGFYGCRKCSRQKAALTSIERYGVDNYSKTDEYKERVEKTNIIKYGYKTNLISPDHIESNKNILMDKYNTDKFYLIKGDGNKKNKFELNTKVYDLVNKDLLLSEDFYNIDNLSNDYLLYRNECRRFTRSNTKELFDNWDGCDYYDKSKIINNFNLSHNDVNYPTIDHKRSVYYGYVNDIDASIIGSIYNLCITKRSINSSKCSQTEDEFIKSNRIDSIKKGI